MFGVRSFVYLVVLCFVLGCVSMGNESVTTTSSTTTLAKEPVNCTQLEQKISSDISSSNVCSKDTDCELTAYSCPFGCRIYSTMNDTSFIDEEVTEFGRQCGVCKKSCSYNGGDLLCDNQKCAPVFSKLVLSPGSHDYKTNESITLILRNLLSRSVYLQKCDEFTLQYRAEGRWNTVSRNACFGENFIQIAPNSSYTLDLNDYNLSLDRFRVEANFWINCYEYPKSKSDCQKNVTLLSDEFRIK